MQTTTTAQQHQQLVKAERRQLRKAERRLLAHPTLSREAAVHRWIAAEHERVLALELESSRG